MNTIDTQPLAPQPGEEAPRGKLWALREKLPRLPRKRPGRRLSGKKLALLAVLAAALIAGGAGIYRLFFAQEEKVAVTGTTTYGLLNEALEGSGTTTPADSVTYTISGTVLEWCVSTGDSVEAGDLLYVLDSSEVEDDIMEYELELEDLYEQYQDLRESLDNQRVTASFDGRVEDVQAEEGDTVQNGTVLASLVDDSFMTATLYFSYTYQDDIRTGQSVNLSIPDQMLSLTGQVTDIQYVNYVTPEGMKCFAVTVEVENPGSLTQGTTAACWLEGADGEAIYAASDAALDYRRQETITAKAAGELTGVNVVDYQQVSAGQTLFTIDASSYQTQLESVEKQITYQEERIADLQESIETEYTRYSDITGQVVYADYATDRMTGQDSGSVTIYNQDSMEITVNIDELNVDYLEEGMEVTVYRTTASDTVYYPAALTYLSLQATSSTSGVSTFEATITIDSEGALSSGVTVYYSIDTSGGDGETGETVLAPLSALCTYDDGYYLLVQSDRRPDGAIDPAQAGGSVTDYPDGYYAVPVEVGGYNENYVQILSGVEEGATLFLRYQNAPPSGGDTTSDAGGEEEGSGFPGGGAMPDFGGEMPSFGGGGMGGGNMGGGMARGG